MGTREKAVRWKRKYRNEAKINAELAKRSKEWKERFLSEREKREELESTVRRTKLENASLRRRVEELESSAFRQRARSSTAPEEVTPLVVHDMEEGSSPGRGKEATGRKSANERTSSKDSGVASILADFLVIGLDSRGADWRRVADEKVEDADLLHCSPRVLFSRRNSQARAKAGARERGRKQESTTEVLPFDDLGKEPHDELDFARQYVGRSRAMPGWSSPCSPPC